MFGKTNAAEAAPAPALPLSRPAPQPLSESAPQGARSAGLPAKSGETFQVRLSSIIALLPKELQQGVSVPKEELTLSLSKVQILPQLAQGAVKITYRELRSAFRAGIFPNRPGEDSRLVEMPLQEILNQLEQKTFERRPGQQMTVVPEEVTPLFSTKGQALATEIRVGKKEENTAEFRRKNVASAPAAPAMAPVPAPAPAPAVAAPRVAAPAAAPMAAAASAPAVETPAKPIAMHPNLAALMNQTSAAAPANIPPYAPPKIENGIFSIAVSDMVQNWPEGVLTEIKAQQLGNVRCEIPAGELTTSMRQGKSQYPWKQVRAWMKPAPVGPSVHGEVVLEMPLKVIANLLLSQASQNPKPASPVEEKAKPAAPVAPPAPVVPAPKLAPVVATPPAAPVHVAAPGVPSGSTSFIKGHTTSFAKKEVVSIPLATISSAWPEVLRKEIEHFNLAESTVAAPVEVLETALKQGKVAFFWKQVCQWIDACPPAAFASNFAEVRLEWPLNVVAPLFLQARPKKEQKAAPLHIEIPDVFNAKNQPAAAPAPAPVPAPVPVPAAAAATEPAPGAPRKVPKDLAELFGEPDKRNWTPNEIVQKTCLLPGLDGALIALQDGLLVATCMPPTWKTETIAAFLPQIFGRMHQYTRELKMGELTSVTFTVEQGTLQIFNAGIIYFAALGKTGATLPVPELNLIARELSRHTK